MISREGKCFPSGREGEFEPEGAMSKRERQPEDSNAAEQDREKPHAFGELRGYVPADILNVSFPAAVVVTTERPSTRTSNASIA
jgi:hypothetical protein